MNFLVLVSDWDKLIRDGQGRSLVETVLALRAADVPDAHLPAVAATARRLGLYKHGLDLLREDYLKHRQRNPEELMTEYAALLTEIGAVQISESILCRFTNPTRPMTYFYRALLWIKKWEHEKAAADLRLFKATTGDPYWRSLADLNLMASLIFLRQWDEAQALLESLESQSASLTTMGKGILSELKGQFLFFSGNLPEARAYFEQSFQTLSATHNPSLIFAEKWVLLCDLLGRPWEEVKPRFRDFQRRARQNGFWEILRELDRFYAVRATDENTLAKLYFGTPASGYKKMLCRDLNWTPPREHFIAIGGEAPAPGDYLDVSTLELYCGGGKISRVPQLNLLLMKALTSDLYRPLAVGSLFEHIYHGQHFDPAFAAQRVHQVISRFRKFAAEHELPLQIDAADLGFSLVAEGGFAVRYDLEAAAANATPDLNSSQVIRLRDSFGTRTFTTADLAANRKISQRSAIRLLNQFVEAGEVEKLGAGKGVKYRIKRAA